MASADADGLVVSDPPTTKEILNIMGKYRAYQAVLSRPQKIQVVGSKLYWLHGSPLGLRSIDVSQVGVEGAEVINVLEATKRSGAMSKEEELLRQRQRNYLAGLTDFRVVAENRIFFEVNGGLHYFDGSTSVNVVEDFKVGPLMDIQPSPVDPFLMAFSCRSNIYLLRVEIDVETGRFIQSTFEQLTHDGTNKLAFGVCDYIIQEEFERYSGYYWSPDGSSILFTITDTSMLTEATVMDGNNELESMPFPKVGDPNATTSFALLDVASKTITKQLTLGTINAAFPWHEYIPRLGWLNNTTLYLELIDRPQERLSIVAVSTAAFAPVGSEAELLSKRSDTLLAAADTVLPFEVLFEDIRPTTWIDISQPLLKLPSQQEGVDVKLALLTRAPLEEGGYRHAKEVSFPPSRDTQRWLTSGKWNVKDRSLQHHAVLNRLFFLATSEEDPLHHDLCSIPTSGGALTRHTTTAHVESFALFSDGTKFAAVVHDGNNVPHIEVGSLDATGSDSPSLSVGTAWLDTTTAALKSFNEDCRAPETFTFPSHDGAPMAAHVFLPDPNHVPQGKKAPLLTYVYGGPHAQLVFRNSFYCRSNALYRTLLRLGVAVAVVDGRMSECNGQEVHKACKRAMGAFETKDYIAAVKHITAKYSDRIDDSRVGIFGWSYGGYSTLLAMAEAPEVFKLGVAGAPVGDWRLYDTGYTERYMGLLGDEGGAAYEKSTIGGRAAGFPDDLNRLIIGHGVTDENVHITHTWHVLSALTAAGKPYQLLAYPGQRHGMGGKARDHFDSMLCRAVMQYL